MPCPNGDAMGAFNWLMPALEKDLKESKMWPIRLFQHKHQDTLRPLNMFKIDQVSHKVTCIYIHMILLNSGGVGDDIEESFLSNIPKRLKRNTSSFSSSRSRRT